MPVAKLVMLAALDTPAVPTVLAAEATVGPMPKLGALAASPFQVIVITINPPGGSLRAGPRRRGTCDRTRRVAPRHVAILGTTRWSHSVFDAILDHCSKVGETTQSGAEPLDHVQHGEQNDRADERHEDGPETAELVGEEDEHVRLKPARP